MQMTEKRTADCWTRGNLSLENTEWQICISGTFTVRRNNSVVLRWHTFHLWIDYVLWIHFSMLRPFIINKKLFTLKGPDFFFLKWKQFFMDNWITEVNINLSEMMLKPHRHFSVWDADFWQTQSRSFFCNMLTSLLKSLTSRLEGFHWTMWRIW